MNIDSSINWEIGLRENIYVSLSVGGLDFIFIILSWLILDDEE